MIGRIQGKLLEISDNHLLVDVSGVAYELEVTTSALLETSAGRGGVPVSARTGAEVTLFTHLVVREDAHLLYGFGSRTERDVFRDLIRINGVGPKLALAIVSGLTLEALADAVRAGDASLLTRVPGVGKKTAERLLVELKDRLGNLHVVVSSVSVGADLSATREAEDALISLGYRPMEAQRAVAAVADLADGAALTGEDLLRAALRQIARQAEAS
ncbi:MAG: Holliday junction branch migration protein RuvA [Pseudomonadales bacterium]